MMRLDHVIARVPDIRQVHARLRERGFAEAWPVGAFWPSALTSGLALGGINLELVQPEVDPPTVPTAATLVLAPGTANQGHARLAEFGIASEVREKWEPDPVLLVARGFQPPFAPSGERICTNVMPHGELPFDFFLCEYAPFLLHRLSPGQFPTPFGEVTRVVAAAPDGLAAEQLLRQLDYSGPTIEWHANPSVQLLEIEFSSGERLRIGDL